MTKVSVYLDLFLRLEPVIRPMFGNKEVSELAADIEQLMPVLKMLGVVK